MSKTLPAWVLILGLMVIVVVTSCTRSSDPAAREASGSRPGETSSEHGGSVAGEDVAAAADSVNAATDYERSVRDLFADDCVTCHSAAARAGHLDLESPGLAERLVGVRSPDAEAFVYVEPGAPERSYLLMKVKGVDGISGRRMPPGGNALEAEDVSLLESWISSLAPTGGTSEPAATGETSAK